MGDIPLGCHVQRWMRLPIEQRPVLANLQAWFDRLCERPAFTKTSISRLPDEGLALRGLRRERLRPPVERFQAAALGASNCSNAGTSSV